MNKLLISNHGPTISGEPRLCRLCGDPWPCTDATAAIKEGVKAVKEGRITPADTFFEWMQAKYVRDIWEERIARLQERVEEAERDRNEAFRWAIAGVRVAERRAESAETLAERRKERFGVASHEVHWLREHEGTLKDCAFLVCVRNRAAIEEEI